MLLGALRKHERWWVGQGELCTLPEKSHSLGGFSNMWGGGGGVSMLKACARLATRWCGMMAEGCRSVGRCPEDA